MTKICLVIPNYKGEKNLPECLESLFKSMGKPKNTQVLIIDNASQPKFISQISKKYSQANWLKNKKNLGFAQAVNQGLVYSQSKHFNYTVILNNDVTFPKSFIKDLEKFISQHPKFKIFSPKIYFYPGCEFHRNRYKKSERGQVIWYAGGKIDYKNWLFSHRGVDQVDQGQFDKIIKTDFATGCCLVLKNELINEIGFLDKRLFAYFEDTDYCLRAAKKNIDSYYAPSIFLWHKNAGSSGSGSFIHDYLLTRNRLLLSSKHAPLKTHFYVLKEALILLIKGRKGQKQAVRDFFNKKFGPGSLEI